MGAASTSRRRGTCFAARHQPACGPSSRATLGRRHPQCRRSADAPTRRSAANDPKSTPDEELDLNAGRKKELLVPQPLWVQVIQSCRWRVTYPGSSAASPAGRSPRADLRGLYGLAASERAPYSRLLRASADIRRLARPAEAPPSGGSAARPARPEAGGAGQTATDMPRDHRIASSLVAVGVKQARIDGGRGDSGHLTSTGRKELNSRRKKLRLLRQKNDFQKGLLLVRRSKSISFCAIEKQCKKYSVRWTC